MFQTYNETCSINYYHFLHQLQDLAAFRHHTRQKQSFAPQEISRAGQTVRWLPAAILNSCWFTHKHTIRKSSQNSARVLCYKPCPLSPSFRGMSGRIWCILAARPWVDKGQGSKESLSHRPGHSFTHIPGRLPWKRPPYKSQQFPRKSKAAQILICLTDKQNLQCYSTIICWTLTNFIHCISFSFTNTPGHAKLLKNFTTVYDACWGHH